jgi:hypothetical protein
VRNALLKWANRLRGYFDKSYVAVGGGDFSVLPVADEPLFRIAQPACGQNEDRKTQTLNHVSKPH